MWPFKSKEEGIVIEPVSEFDPWKGAPKWVTRYGRLGYHHVYFNDQVRWIKPHMLHPLPKGLPTLDLLDDNFLDRLSGKQTSVIPEEDNKIFETYWECTVEVTYQDYSRRSYTIRANISFKEPFHSFDLDCLRHWKEREHVKIDSIDGEHHIRSVDVLQISLSEKEFVRGKSWE